MHILLAVDFCKGLVGEGFAGMDIENPFEDGNTLVIAIRGEQEDAEVYYC